MPINKALKPRYEGDTTVVWDLYETPTDQELIRFKPVKMYVYRYCKGGAACISFSEPYLSKHKGAGQYLSTGFTKGSPGIACFAPSNEKDHPPGILIPEFPYIYIYDVG